MSSSNWKMDKVLSDTLQGIGIALVRGTWRDVAAAILKSEPIRALVTEQILKQLQKECAHLCGKDVSLLRRSTASDLVSLRWSSLIDEWKKESPLFYAFLLAVAAPSRSRNVIKGIDLESRFPVLCMAGSILLKERNTHMSAIQHLTGLIVFHGDCSKQVS